jgi:FlaA1/EpsC-like NDP-sugar epimerase
MQRAMRGVDIVIHTAAMKHVDISEYNPFEAIKTNVLGLQNVIDASIDASVEKFVFTSSDKSVNPANTMGTTKLLGEHLVRAGNKYSGGRNIKLSSVRFGNVVNSSQSVIPLFAEQIRSGGPVTLTNENMTRFFLTSDDIERLIRDTMANMAGGEVFVQQMDALRIQDLANAMIETVAPQYGYDPAEVEIDLIGRRVGETLHEEIMTEREMHRAVQRGDLYAIPPEEVGSDVYFEYGGLDAFDEANDVSRTSIDAEMLSYEEVVDFVEDQLNTVVADE